MNDYLQQATLQKKYFETIKKWNKAVMILFSMVSIFTYYTYASIHITWLTVISTILMGIMLLVVICINTALANSRKNILKLLELAEQS